MSTAFDEVFTALVAGGMEPKRAAFLLSELTARRSQPTPGALRVRKHRERKALQSVTVTPRIQKYQSNQTESMLRVTQKPPIIEREEEERKDSKISDIRPTADLRSLPRPPAGEFDWESSDGTIFVSADQINRWAEMFPGVNIRAQLRGARREYLSGPITSEIFCRRFEKGLHTKAAKKRAKDQHTVEHKIVAQAAIEDDYERRQRALAVRNKYHGIGRG